MISSDNEFQILFLTESSKGLFKKNLDLLVILNTITITPWRDVISYLTRVKEVVPFQIYRVIFFWNAFIPLLHSRGWNIKRKKNIGTCNHLHLAVIACILTIDIFRKIYKSNLRKNIPILLRVMTQAKINSQGHGHNSYKW